jgi:general stress protein 26
VLNSQGETIRRINELISDIDVAMLTTLDANGDFQSRPMLVLQPYFYGDIWFLAHRDSEKVRSISQNPLVNVNYVNDGVYISITGKAAILSETQKKSDLWHKQLKLWLKNGPEASDVVLIHITATSAQYWDTGYTIWGHWQNQQYPHVHNHNHIRLIDV